MAPETKGNEKRIAKFWARCSAIWAQNGRDSMLIGIKRPFQPPYVSVCRLCKYFIFIYNFFLSYLILTARKVRMKYRKQKPKMTSIWCMHYAFYVQCNAKLEKMMKTRCTTTHSMRWNTQHTTNYFHSSRVST